MLEDSDPRKWRMKGQTEVKHEILRAYLKPWLFKISEITDKVTYLDGFAGRGKYTDGSVGSPIIAIQSASDISDSISHKLNSFECIFVEKDEEVHGNLKQTVEAHRSQSPNFVSTTIYQGEFEEHARKYIEMQKHDPKPGFIFIDPFGFSGLPFNVVRELTNLRESGVEVFINFMSGKMAQFMESDSHATAITEILGTDRWKEVVSFDAEKDKRAKQLLKVYEDQLRDEAGIEYVWPFEMTEETKDQNCYYLIHATNHFEGFRLMKQNMFSKGDNGQFAYLGPEHYRFEEEQTSFTDFGSSEENEDQIEELADYLFNRFEGQTLTFINLLKLTLEETKHVDKHYRDACKYLDGKSRANIIRHPEKGGTKQRGIKDPDEIEFVDRRIQSFY